jgi:hypothetical protein
MYNRHRAGCGNELIHMKENNVEDIHETCANPRKHEEERR